MSWSDAIFYHLYPLGVTGAPWKNPGGSVEPRILQLIDWIEPAVRIGCDAVLFGPVWESGSHGYDTHDYRTPDRRLGTAADLKRMVTAWKERGFRIVFDGVFHHCGRGFAPFADLIEHGRESSYVDWFSGVDFSRTSPYGDPFSYEGWNGHLSLVKFNLSNLELRDYLFSSVAAWMDDYGIDGLRLDAADVMDKDFQRDLASFCHSKHSDFWLMGEVIHGTYTDWAPGAGLDSVTNYELFKGLWSSHNDGNYFEAAWSLNRQFGAEGLYRGQTYVTFGDNHDVNRLASTLTKREYLYPHAILQAATPGIPMVYYGSEAGLTGVKTNNDEPLRPALKPSDLDALPQQGLRDLWFKLAKLRKTEPALTDGGYEQAKVASRQFAFWRLPAKGRPLLVAVNSSDGQTAFSIPVPPQRSQGTWVDLLSGDRFSVSNGSLEITLWPCWGRILVPV
jgi:glycosidase